MYTVTRQTVIAAPLIKVSAPTFIAHICGSDRSIANGPSANASVVRVNTTITPALLVNSLLRCGMMVRNCGCSRDTAEARRRLSGAFVGRGG